MKLFTMPLVSYDGDLLKAPFGASGSGELYRKLAEQTAMEIAQHPVYASDDIVGRVQSARYTALDVSAVVLMADSHHARYLQRVVQRRHLCLCVETLPQVHVSIEALPANQPYPEWWGEDEALAVALIEYMKE